MKLNISKKNRLAYLAGIFDSEGCVMIARYNHLGYARGYRYQMLIVIGNCYLPLLKQINTLYGGYIHTRKATEAHRALYSWSIRCKMASSFLKDIRPYMLLKTKQADLALAFQKSMNSIKVGGYKPKKELAIQDIRHHQMRYFNSRDHAKTIASPNIPPKGILPSYIAGLLDGDGCISLVCRRPDSLKRSPYYKLLVSISNNILRLSHLLYEMYEGFTFAQNHSYGWQVGSNKACSFLKSTLPFLTIKRKQAELAIMYQESRIPHGRRFKTSDERIRDYNFYNNIKVLNHI